MRAINLFIRAVLEEARHTGGAGGSPTVNIDPDARDIIAVQPSINIDTLMMPPAVKAAYVNTNAYLIQNMAGIAEDVKKVLEKHPEVGLRWSRDDYEFLARGVYHLLKLDADSGNDYYPYRTALFVISYRAGIVAPIDAIMDAWNYTDTFLEQLKSYSPIKYTPRTSEDADVEEEEEPFMTPAAVGTAAAAALAGGGVWAAKVLKKYGAEQAAKAAGEAIAGSSIGRSWNVGALRGVIDDPKKVKLIFGAIFGEPEASGGFGGLVRGTRSLLSGLPLTEFSQAGANLRREATRLSTTAKGKIKFPSTSIATVGGNFDPFEGFDKRVIEILEEIIDDLARNAQGKGIDSGEAAGKWLDGVLGGGLTGGATDTAGLRSLIPPDVFDKLTDAQKGDLLVLDAILRSNQFVSLEAFKTSMQKLGGTYDGTDFPQSNELRKAIVDVFALFYDALGSRTGMGVAGTAARSSVAGIFVGSIALIGLKAGFTGITDVLGVDANDTTEVPTDVVRVIATDIRMRRAAADAMGYMVRRPAYGEFTTKIGNPLMIGTSMESLEELLQTSPGTEIAGVQMIAVADQFKTAMTEAGETIEFDSDSDGLPDERDANPDDPDVDQDGVLDGNDPELNLDVPQGGSVPTRENAMFRRGLKRMI